MPGRERVRLRVAARRALQGCQWARACKPQPGLTRSPGPRRGRGRPGRVLIDSEAAAALPDCQCQPGPAAESQAGPGVTCSRQASWSHRARESGLRVRVRTMGFWPAAGPGVGGPGWDSSESRRVVGHDLPCHCSIRF